jgi:hypothetical protein
MVCEKDVKAEDCICAAVVCPANAPTYWPATATATATSAPTSAIAAKREELNDAPAPAGPPCCCCDPSKDAIVCEVRAQGEDNTCVCPMVKCSANVKTLTVWPSAKETGI